jgi:solute carrier family 35 protein
VRTTHLSVIFDKGAISVAITIFNKAVLSQYHFNYPNTLALGQMIFSLGFLVLMKRFKLLEYHDFSYEVASKVTSLIH